MSKKVIILSSSLRKSGNSERLAAAFAKGAAAAGHTVKTLTFRDKEIGFCRGCLSCQSTGKCVIRDDANAIVAEMKSADVIVFATPIYYYEMSGQLKVLLDRSNPLYASDYAFRDIYFLSTAADDAEDTDRRALGGLSGWIACFERARLAGSVFAGGVNAVGEIDGHPALEKAYTMGQTI